MKYGCTDRRFVESTLRFPSPLTSPPSSSSFSRARERAERNPLACKNSTKTIAIIVRYDIDSISRGTRTERERVLLEDFRLDFILAKGSSEADSNRFPSFGRCSFSRDGCASLRLGRERERWWLLLVSSRRARVGIARKRVDEEEGSRSLEETSEARRVSAQRGVVRSPRLGRWVARIAVAVGEAKKGKERVGEGKKEKHGSGYHDASSRRVRCPRPGRVCARTTL